MREAVIVSTARTGIGRAYKGSLNNTKSPTMLGHAIAQAVQRAGVDGAEVEDVVIGTVLTSGTAGMNLARNATLAAGLPATVSGQTMDRQCASGLMAVATAAKQVMVDGMQIVVAGGHENITAEQKNYFEGVMASKDPNLERVAPTAYMPIADPSGKVSVTQGMPVYGPNLPPKLGGVLLWYGIFGIFCCNGLLMIKL